MPEYFKLKLKFRRERDENFVFLFFIDIPSQKTDKEKELCQLQTELPGKLYIQSSPHQKKVLQLFSATPRALM